jgi:molybdopterin-guanine dinucleotide biosynthesis protein A
MEKMTGFILAGGKSTRMKEDKGLMLLNGKAIVRYVIDALMPCVEEVIIVSNNEAYTKFGCKVIPDLVKDAGPLGGIFTGLRNSKTHYNFFVSCDMPFITSEAILYLMEHAKEDEITVPTVDGALQPLCGIYSKAITSQVKNSIQDRKLKLTSFIAESKHRLVMMEKRGLDLNLIFMNINTREDYVAALRME